MAVTALSKSAWCRQLQFLYLDDNAFGYEGVKALGLGVWSALYVFSLNHCSFESDTAVTGLAHVHFPELTSLSLTDNCFEEAAAPYLTACADLV